MLPEKVPVSLPVGWIRFGGRDRTETPFWGVPPVVNPDSVRLLVWEFSGGDLRMRVWELDTGNRETSDKQGDRKLREEGHISSYLRGLGKEESIIN